jgi:hypothetical protein
VADTERRGHLAQQLVDECGVNGASYDGLHSRKGVILQPGSRPLGERADHIKLWSECASTNPGAIRRPGVHHRHISQSARERWDRSLSTTCRPVAFRPNDQQTVFFQQAVAAGLDPEE